MTEYGHVGKTMGHLECTQYSYPKGFAVTLLVAGRVIDGIP